jgi:ABC-type sugar transport system ATPase subunit/ribose/xylose/arabinose/galactoside ABC-type transport system permease subunit
MAEAACAAPARLVAKDPEPSAEGGTQSPLLLMTSVSKSFGTTRAVREVDFAVRPAEIVGLMGGNGAGKSTLMKIVGGLLAPDEGAIELLHQRLGPRHSPRAAMELGLRFVHQELSLCANLRIYENFALELPDVIRGARWRSTAAEFAKAALDDVFPGHGIDPRAKVSALSLSQRQMVEIARAASHPAARLLILDEPTSSLGSRQAEQLRTYMKRRRVEGLSFIFISHRLHESLDVADRVTVMRNGRVAWAGETGGIGVAQLMELLGGKHTARDVAHSMAGASGRDALVRVRDLRQGSLRGVSLEVGRGEIVGLAGLEGSGQREVLRAVFAGRQRGDEVTVGGNVAFVSGDRASEGIFPLWSIGENIAVSSLRRLTRWGLISTARLRALTARWIDRLKVQAPSAATGITSLSGGNQQKVVIARALAADANIVLLDDPTRGVDMGTKSDLYRLFRGLADEGRAVLWYSTDDTEFAECDRTLVMRDGAVIAEYDRSETSQERLVAASFRQIESERDTGHAQRTAERARRRESVVSMLIPLVTFAIVFATSVAQNPLILSALGLKLVFSAAFALSFATISQLFIITAGDIDLGLGTFIGLVNAVAATWLVSDPWLALLCFLGMLVAYPLMGLFIDARRVPAIIVTLGLSFVWLGLAAWRLPRAGGSAPGWLVDLLRIDVPVVPLPVLLAVFPAIVAYLVLFVWRYGAVMRGFGASPRAIEAAGWSTRQAKATLYAIAGMFAFLAGIVVTASTRGGDPTGSVSMTLLSVAAVILGGAAFSGGLIAPIGALFGTLTLVMVGTLLSLFEVNAVYLPMVQGLMLLGAIGVRTLLIGRTAS